MSTGGSLTGFLSAGTPTSGRIGEVLTANIAVADTVSLTTATATNITSLTLTPGVWQLNGICSFVVGSTAVTTASAGINATIATLSLVNVDFANANFPISQTTSLATPFQHVIINAPTTYYLNVSATFASQTCTCYGKMRAVRIA